MNKIYIIQSSINPTNNGSMYATNVVTRDIRLQGYNVEKILVDYFENMKSINDKVSKISKEEIENDLYETLKTTIGDINDKISIVEQQAIADALTKVDNLITSLTKVIEKKKLIKKGAMQKLLSGEMRLDGFEGEWERKQIGKIGITYSGITGKNKSDFGHGTAKYITFLNVLNNPIINNMLISPVAGISSSIFSYTASNTSSPFSNFAFITLSPTILYPSISGNSI